MKEKDLKIDKFVKLCMNNTYSNGAKENNEWYVKCLEKAKDTEDFLQYYFSTYDKKIICCQAYGELLKEVRTMLDLICTLKIFFIMQTKSS